MTKTVKVNCAGCTACCRNEDLILHPEHGDRPEDYQTRVVMHPLNGRPAFALKKNFMGDCIYLDRATGCTIYDRRPMLCREFTCVGLVAKIEASVLQMYVSAGMMSADVIEAGRKRLANSGG